MSHNLSEIFLQSRISKKINDENLIEMILLKKINDMYIKGREYMSF